MKGLWKVKDKKCPYPLFGSVYGLEAEHKFSSYLCNFNHENSYTYILILHFGSHRNAMR